MLKIGALALALAGVSAANAAAAALESEAPYGFAPPAAYAPPPPILVLPPGQHFSHCYASASRKEFERGLRHWTGRCDWS